MTKTEKRLLECLKKTEKVLDSIWLRGHIHVGDEYGETISKAIGEAKDAIEAAEDVIEAPGSVPKENHKAYVYSSPRKICQAPQYHMSVHEDFTRKYITVTVHALSQIDVQYWVHAILNLTLKDGKKPKDAYFRGVNYGLSELILMFEGVTMDDSRTLARGVAVTLDSFLEKYAVAV